MNCCSHLFEIGNVTPRTPNGCEECLKMGDRWLHLRLCVTCGHVGCCDDSKNKHAAKHFHSTNHPLITVGRTTRRIPASNRDSQDIRFLLILKSNRVNIKTT